MMNSDDFVELVRNNTGFSVHIQDILIELCFLKNGQGNEVATKLINLVGNNHQGVYYPNIIPVLDYLILLLNHSQNNRVRKICLLGILNDLYYFEADVNHTFFSKDELECQVRQKLFPYSDEYFNDLVKSVD